ncbi:MAG: 1-acyl-sn-glycerol-3-phosphate acyltransferase [Arachnia propionica]|nr:MAG: 1-acyl-sn-glycerol-3-phosphate acyltransferase [Arachnia propionica]
MLLLRPYVWRSVRVRVHGGSHLDSLEPPFVVFANHSSHLDAPLIFGALPWRLSRFLATGAAGDYFYNKWWKGAPMSLFFNAYPIQRQLSTKRKSKKRGKRGLSAALLADGIPLLIFPEGSRSRTGAMGPFKPGVASLCISNGAPALPMALVGAYDAWPPQQRHLPKGRPEIHVVIGRPMLPRQGEIAHEFNERMRRQVLELHDTTARAYGRKTLAEYARTLAIESAKTNLDDVTNPDTQRADQEES